MIITTTSIAFLILGSGLWLCGWWFSKALKKSGHWQGDGRVGFLISLFFLGYGVHSLTLGIGSFFSITNPTIFSFIFSVTSLLLSLLAVLGVYIGLYIFFPRSNTALPLTITSAVGILAVVISVLELPRPVMSVSGSLDFNLGPTLSLLTWILSILSIGAPLYIFSKLFLFTKSNNELKWLSAIITFLASMGVVNVSVRLLTFLPIANNFRGKFFDIGAALVGIIFITALYSVSLNRKKIYLKNKKVL